MSSYPVGSVFVWRLPGASTVHVTATCSYLRDKTTEVVAVAREDVAKMSLCKRCSNVPILAVTHSGDVIMTPTTVDDM